MAGEEFFHIIQRPISDSEATCRSIFLDFDQSRPRPVAYFTPNAQSEAKLNAESIDRIVATLNEVFMSQQIEFVSEPPDGDNYHTIHVEPAPKDAIDIDAVVVEKDSEQKLVEAIAAQAEAMLKAKQNR